MRRDLRSARPRGGTDEAAAIPVSGGARPQPPSSDLGIQTMPGREWQQVMHMAEVVLQLRIRDLTREDLPACASTASPESNFAAALERADRSEVDYLVLCLLSTVPMAVGSIDDTLSAGAGTLYQLAVHGALHSCGSGSLTASWDE